LRIANFRLKKRPGYGKAYAVASKEPAHLFNLQCNMKSALSRAVPTQQQGSCAMATSEFSRHESGPTGAVPASGDPEEELVAEPAADKATPAIMPWALRVLLHLGVGLLAGVITMVTVHQVNKLTTAAVYVPGQAFSESLGEVVNPGDLGSNDGRSRDGMKPETGSDDHRGPEQASAQTGGPFDSDTASKASDGPRCAFFGLPGNAHHVVYCIDASGSMAFASNNGGSVFDLVRIQMLTSISRLSEVQDFDIVMFQEGPPIGLNAKGLLPVTPENRSAAARWLNEVIPHGAGADPIPALNCAFDVLDNADGTRAGKQIFLLTDGAFPDNDAVLKCIRERNKAKDVHVFTYLYGEQDDPSIIKLMRDIAVETGGRYKNIAD
jgi:hypothetical protein